MQLRRAAAVAIVAGAVIGETDTRAHHSFSPHFDPSRPVSIDGTITSFEAQNPHSYVHINAVDENGRTRKYVCESHGVTQLTRNGITSQINEYAPSALTIEPVKCVPEGISGTIRK